ncbi:MAG: 30S ribosomal protein S7 [candidate division WWE3 bacterium]|nr:30S ribosomal protein S7 [candidate division WWE3 bacterium]
MSRSGIINKKPKELDSVYKSRVVTRLLSLVMRGGEKATAKRLIYAALARLSPDTKEAATQFEQAVKLVMPKMEVRSRRVGGANYQVPMPLKHERSEALALRWMVTAARARKGKPFEEKFFLEIKDALNNTGAAIKKRDDVHRMAEANKAFAHFKF